MIEKLKEYEYDIRYKLKIHEEGINGKNLELFKRKINHYNILIQEIEWLFEQYNKNDNRIKHR